MDERKYHRLFTIAIVVKTIDSIAETAGGLILYFVGYPTLREIAIRMTGDELLESPRDFPWNYLSQVTHGFLMYSQSFWTILLLIHGVTKLLLLLALWKEKLWAYPIAAAAFTIFAAYEIYEIIMAPSLLLGIVALIDVILVGLILHEYRYRRNRLNLI